MTRSELIKMTGSEEQANFAINYILGSIKPAFIITVVKARLSEIQDRLNELSKLGKVAAYTNGSWSANYGAVYSGEASQEQYEEVDILLYESNRLTSIIAGR